MASPYALDFSPIQDLGNRNKQLELLWAKNKLAEDENARAAERLGFERERQPLTIAALTEANRHAGAWNPLLEKEKTSELEQRALTDPYDLMAKKAAAEAAKEGLDVTRQYRQEQGFGVPNTAARLPTTGGATAAPTTPPAATKAAPVQWYAPAPASDPDRAVKAAKAADFVETHVLKPAESDPNHAAGQWKQFLADPAIAQRWQQHVDAYGSSGNLIRDASDFVRDMRHEANGTVLKPFERSSAADASLAPQQQGVVAQTAPVRAAQAAPQPVTTNAPLYPSLGGAMQSAERMAAVPGMSAAAEAKFKTLQGMVEKGYMPTRPGSPDQVMDLSGSSEVGARRKGMEEAATANAKYYDTLHKGLAGSAMIAAQQKQNIGILRTILADPGFGFGSVSGLQQGTLRALATVGLAPEVAANREVFNQTMARILADQFSGMKSLASTTGETGARIFKPMLDIEEKAIAHSDDTVEGIKRKVDILDQAGDLMMRWGDLADAHSIQNGGRLDARFDSALRGEIAKARIAYGPQSAERPGQAKEGAPQQAPGAPVTKDALLGMPDGPVLNGKYIKRGTQLFPVQGDPGTVGNPHAKKTDVTDHGQYAFDNGKLYKRTPNLIADRWEEVK